MHRSPVRLARALIAPAIVAGTLAVVPGATAATPSTPALAPDPEVRGPFVGAAVAPAVFDVNLKSLPTARRWRPGRPARYVPLGPPRANRVVTVRERPHRGGAVEPNAIPSAPTAGLFSTPEESFDGIAFTGFFPPDTNGDVGPNHYVQSVNAAFAVYDKQGTLLSGPSTIRSLFAGAPVTPGLPASSVCRTTNRGDPVVLYDPMADRWLISQFGFNTDSNNDPIPPFSQCVAISQTPNPVSGGWFLYDFPTPNTMFPDYPKYGVWPDAYYMTTNQFGGTGGGGAYALDRANMLAGAAATQIYFDTPERNMLPSDLDGPTPPPAGAPNHFAKVVDGSPDRIEIRDFHVDFAVPANSTFSVPVSIPVGAFDSDMCGGGLGADQCIPQPSPAPTSCAGGSPSAFGCLSSIPDRLLFRLAYRNFGTHETLVTNHTVDVGGDKAGIFWHELRLASGTWSVFQEGIHSPDATHRWMGAIAMDKHQGIALGYSVSSGSVFPGIRYAGRLASDPAGTLPQGEATLIDGTGSQTACQGVDLTDPPDGTFEFCRGRWGDYSSMSVDPVDDCTFWYTQQYMPPSGQWRTRIGAFRLCNDPPTADADGPYTTAEGTDVVLDGTGSSDPNPTDSLVLYEWDLDDDGLFDDATGPTPTFDLVGQDGVFPISLRVTDEAGDTGTDSTTVTVTNVAPSLVGVVEDSPKPENTAVTISGTASDPGWLEPDLDVTIDWDDGSPVDIVNGPDENVRPDATTAFSVSHVYGDNGVFNPEVCALDDDSSTCTIVPVTFTNVDPTAVIDLSGATIIDGVPTILADAGDPVTFDGNSTDPGSDDLTLTWDFGDGPPSPDATTFSLVNPPNSDPPNSPSIQPRDVDDTQVHTFGEACTYVVTFASDDDDGGHGESMANVVIQGTAGDAQKHAYWKRQYGGEGRVHFTQAQLECYLLIADHVSNVFHEVRDASTFEAAYVVLQGSAGGPPVKQLDRELLTALLNFANGAFGFDELVHDADGDGVLDTSFGDVIATAEAVRLNPASTPAQIREQRDILRDVNAL